VLLAVATDPGYTRGVWAVEPTYFLACRIFDDAGLRVAGVPDGEGGVDVAALRERLVEAERERGEELKGGADRPVSSVAWYCESGFDDESMVADVGRLQDV
jgi:hypothetical protein